MNQPEEKERIKYDKLTGWKRTIENARLDERKKTINDLITDTDNKGVIEWLKHKKKEWMK